MPYSKASCGLRYMVRLASFITVSRSLSQAFAMSEHVTAPVGKDLTSSDRDIRGLASCL